MLASRFGTARGLVRLALAHIEVRLGTAGLRRPVAAEVTRLVFVCQGNICRSAFLDVVARRHGLNAASFGLATTSGMPAHGPAIAAAARLGYHLETHRTTCAADYWPAPGDLLLAMEVRQLRALARHARFARLPRTLAGLYTRPAFPHVHDPYTLSDAYTLTCLTRLERAIAPLARAFPNAATDD